MTPEQLKASILQYAIQGKLVEQRPEEGTAEDLYKSIQEAKQKLIKEGKIKKEKPLDVIAEDEIPFDIPDSWKWIRVSSICKIINGDRGKNYPSKATLKKEGIPFISALNLDGKTVKKDDNLLCLSEEQYNKLGSGKLDKGDIVVCIRGSLGKHGRYPFEKGAIASSLVICRQYCKEDVLADFFMMYLDAPLFYSLIKKYDNGTAQPNLSAKSFEEFLFPLPPLAEQHRIVAKIEELLPFVDRYAASYEKLEQFNAKFPEDMKKSILQYAIQGKLVEQRPEEGTAEDLYKDIQEEKQKMIKAGKIKKEKPLAEITEDEMPFDIPDSWKWVRISTIGITQTGNTPKKSHPEYFGSDIPFLGPGDIQNGIINYENQGLSDEGKEYGRITLANSILQVCIGGSIGKCALVDREVAFNQQINSIYPLIANSEYVYHILDSSYFKNYMKDNAGGTATPIINRGLWDAIVIPLPPLKEQERIVAKIKQLLPFCERLIK